MRWFLIVWLLFGLTIPADALSSDAGAGGQLLAVPLQAMVGERYEYTLDFFIFKDLAEGRLQFTAEKEPGRYRAELVAHTLGVASWLSGDRTQRYLSIMEEDGTGRLRSISHESSIHKRKGKEWLDRQKRYRFDYQAGKVYQDKGEQGHFKPGLVFELPAGQPPVDILTGFYNLRSGVYGKLSPGTRLKIPTFSTKGISEIDVEVLTDSQRQTQLFFPLNGTLLRIKVDPEIFDTGGADLYAWFNENGQPERGIVENVIGLGDVQGRLREEQPDP